jgi:plasmid stabilization system protein ParE
MKYHIAVSPGAEVDIDSASLWYEPTDPKLGFRFLSETDATIKRIRQYPYEFPLIRGKVRRALLKRFPYSVYYSILSDGVSIIAVLHQRRSETVWINRGNDSLG